MATVLVLALSSIVLAQNITLAPVITTVAGNGSPGCKQSNIGDPSCYGGDGGPATAAQINLSPSVTVDRAGNIYIADYFRVRKVDTSGIITTVAGDGTYGSGGDNGPATSAQVAPASVATDSAGNLYIADNSKGLGASGNGPTIRKVDARGIITTVAGNGSGGFSGDGGPAINASFTSIEGITVDSAGNLFIATEVDNRIRKVDTRGIINTVAGDGSPRCGPVDLSPCFGGDGGPAVKAHLFEPAQVAVDGAGNLYIADWGNARIRKVDTKGIITTVAGNGGFNSSGNGGPATSAEIGFALGVALDGAGNLYLATNSNAGDFIRRVDSKGIISTLAGNGSATYSGDGGPAIFAGVAISGAGALFDGIAVNNVGDVYFPDGSLRIRKVSKGNNAPTDFGQVNVGASKLLNIYLSINNPVTLSSAQASGDFAVLSNTCAISAPLTEGTICALQVQFAPSQAGPRSAPLIVTDGSGTSYAFGLEGTGISPLLAFTPGIITTIAGGVRGHYNGDGIPATSAAIDPENVALDSDGNVFIADYSNHRIRKVDVNGTMTTVAGNGTGGYSGDGGPATSAEIFYPEAVKVDSAGNLYIADSQNNRIRKVDVNGTITTVAGNGSSIDGGDGGPATNAGLNFPEDIAFDRAGNLYIVDTYNNRIRKVDAGGTITTVAGNGSYGFSGDFDAATKAALGNPTGLAFDDAGNYYIADRDNHRIRKVDVFGNIYTVAGDGTGGFAGDGGFALAAELYYPYDVALDSAGNLYIADTYNNRIRKVDIGGGITTVAGNGTYAYGGDNGSATSAQLAFPEVVAVDTMGNLYISDNDNGRIRKVDVTTAAMAFGTVNVGQKSAPQSVQLTNVGNSLLNFLGFPITSNFLLMSVGNDCGFGTSLAPGTSCNLGAVFAPQTSGSPLTGTINAFDNALNSPQTVALSGTALTPPPVTVTIATNPSGLNVTVVGVGCQAGSYTSPATLQWTPASSCAVSFTSPQGTVGVRYVFTGWADNVAANPRGITGPAAATTYTANFKTQYQLTTSVNPAASGTITGAGFYDAGTQATAAATAGVGYVFANWAGPVVSATSATTKVSMNAPVKVTANFTPVPVIAPILSSRIGPSNARVWSVAVPNTGKAAATNTQVNSFLLAQTAGAACTPVVVTPFPIGLGTIAPGGSATANITVNFTGCPAAARFTLKLTYSANGGLVKGTVVRYNLFQ